MGLDGMDVADICKRAILIHCWGTEGQCVFTQLTADTSTFGNVESTGELLWAEKEYHDLTV